MTRRRPDAARPARPDGVDDLPRRPDGTPFIGDIRNDENVILSQLHVAFIKAHNKLLDGRLARFADAQRLTRWHFQWIIVHDFLEHVVGEATVNRFLVTRNGRIQVRPRALQAGEPAPAR